MDTKQQQETLNYFDAFAKDWKEKAQGQKVAKVNVISQRNNYVLEVVKTRVKNSKTLDVGCGTGELVHEIAKLNIPAQGVDFANEMIKLAKEIASKENLANTEFVCASIFDFKIDNNSLDVISANGFLEYISYEQFDSFLAIAYNALQKDGSLVLGSRNRLFNIFSMNEYTSNEIANHNIEKLLNEAILLTKLIDPSDLLKIDAVPLEKPDATHGNTGIDVSTRFQFTPAQLAKMLDAKGFAVKELCPIHIHGVSPAFAAGHKEIHFNVSNLLSQVTDDDKAGRNKLIPSASSFMIHAVKK
ncbi:MAG: methyltransferase domain-containing protein [Ferruginibacter sp.]